MKLDLKVVKREPDGTCVLENGMRVRIDASGLARCVGFETAIKEVPSANSEAGPPSISYQEAINRACACAVSQDYAGSTAWLDIARELRLREAREMDTSKPGKPRANPSGRSRNNAKGLNFD